MRDQDTYKRILTMARMCGMSRHDADAFYAAYSQAQTSTFDICRVGCVIMIGNTVVGRGCNTEKSDPYQKAYNVRYRTFEKGNYSDKEHSLHAEMAALKSITYPVARQLNWKRAKAYVFRIAPGLPLGQGLSAPCDACARALADVGVRKVLFSTEVGFASANLDDLGKLVMPSFPAEEISMSGRYGKNTSAQKAIA